MKNLYQYFCDKLVDDPVIAAVYESMGEGEISQLTSSVRDAQFPCVVCEVGDDGEINLSDCNCDKNVQLFYVLEKVSTRSNDDVTLALAQAKRKGIELLSMIKRDSRNLGDNMYGVDLSSVKYYKVPLGRTAVGYCFVLTFYCE